MIPYIITPKWARVLQRIFFSARYTLLGAAGLVAALNDMRQIKVIGWVLILAAFVALLGVSTRRFQLELVPIWFLLAGLTWAAGYLFTTGRPTSGVLVLALVPALAERLLHLVLVANRARRAPSDGESDGAE